MTLADDESHSKVAFVVADVDNYIVERVGDSFVTVGCLARARQQRFVVVVIISL